MANMSDRCQSNQWLSRKDLALLLDDGTAESRPVPGDHRLDDLDYEGVDNLTDLAVAVAVGTTTDSSLQGLVAAADVFVLPPPSERLSGRVFGVPVRGVDAVQACFTGAWHHLWVGEGAMALETLWCAVVDEVIGCRLVLVPVDRGLLLPRFVKPAAAEPTTAMGYAERWRRIGWDIWQGVWLPAAWTVAIRTGDAAASAMVEALLDVPPTSLLISLPLVSLGNSLVQISRLAAWSRSAGAFVCAALGAVVESFCHAIGCEIAGPTAGYAAGVLAYKLAERAGANARRDLACLPDTGWSGVVATEVLANRTVLVLRLILELALSRRPSAPRAQLAAVLSLLLD